MEGNFNPSFFPADSETFQPPFVLYGPNVILNQRALKPCRLLVDFISAYLLVGSFSSTDKGHLEI